MTKFFFLTIPSIFLVSVSFAQIPELDIRNNSIVPQTGSEKVRLAYDRGDYLAAESLLYPELEKGNITANDFLLFANILNSVNKPSLAKEFYGEYAKGTENKDAEIQIQRLFSSNVSTTEQRTIETNYPITNPTTYNSQLFTEIGGRIMSYDKTCEGDLNNRSEVLKGITDAPFGSIAFFDNGEMAVASLIDTKSNLCRLYLFYKKKGTWKKPVELFSETEGNFAFPFIDEETKTLYFSSDKSGSLGGYDIYKSVYSGRIFESPRNLGNGINSTGNDINPTLIKDWLYFSSNGHISKGGYDIFKYKKLSEFNALFTNVLELNTLKNELSVVPGGTNALLINRAHHDTTKLVNILRPKVVCIVSGVVTNESGEPVPGAFVLFNTDERHGDYLTTGAEGQFIFKSARNFPSISGVVMADGYLSKAFIAPNGEIASIQLDKLKPVEVIVEVIRTVPVNPSESITDTSTGVSGMSLGSGIDLEQTSKHGDSSSYLIVIASKYDYSEAYDSWTTWLPSFNKAEILEYDNSLYRVGFYVGNDEDEAVTLYNKAKEFKKDIWLLHPTN